jgi:uncharacterized protein (DUF952 family)
MIPSPGLLVHLISAEEWERAKADGRHRPESLDVAGFVHLSAPAQVHLPANRLYAGRTDLLLLWCNPERFDDPLRWEPGVPTDPQSMVFPHLYGTLPTAAVVSVSPYPPKADGTFEPLPADQDGA